MRTTVNRPSNVKTKHRESDLEFSHGKSEGRCSLKLQGTMISCACRPRYSRNCAHGATCNRISPTSSVGTDAISSACRVAVCSMPGPLKAMHHELRARSLTSIISGRSREGMTGQHSPRPHRIINDRRWSWRCKPECLLRDQHYDVCEISHSNECRGKRRPQ
jgi:hypothetical protein